MSKNIQVAIKVRPLLRKEREQKQVSSWKVVENSIQLVDSQTEPFYFDHIFDQDASNQCIFDTMAKHIVDAALRGFNGTIFAYGQTSSGKTYTMMGDGQNEGVIVLAAKEIFKEIEKATERQFLLRVGYIEIYNEKLVDLLNKKNLDLKIHETPTGDVSVNCEECIITSEQELLNFLCLGSKQRKIGETNMNERSSRSHTIFRIIIESRKIDISEDDSVQMSILNLVDLAGSERADQTGATGSRLKEGGHINKSLMFLSCVINALAENQQVKFINFRDSKLTRILQASLGGNALTSIICTIKPSAVEETYSTLSFATRAKTIKNKPQVNEILTDAAMMKRLEKEISRLQSELAEERKKNMSQLKVGQLEKRINDENLKIISSNSLFITKANKEKRRRTWCTTTLNDEITLMPVASTMAPTQMATRLQLPKASMFYTPQITLRGDPNYNNDFDVSPTIDEEFTPGEMANFDMMITPRTSPTNLSPTSNSENKFRVSLTPKMTMVDRVHRVERELEELKVFTNLENNLNVEHDTYGSLKNKLKLAEIEIANYKREREEFIFMKEQHLETESNLSEYQSRCNELEVQINKLDNSLQSANDKVTNYEQEIQTLNSKIKQLEMENREAVAIEFEFQRHKQKSKLREDELLEVLEEKKNEIAKLEKSLQTLSAEMIQNSKDELLHLSGDIETDCVKCEHRQRLLEENNKTIRDYEKLSLEHEQLQLQFKETQSAVELAQSKVIQLESENLTIKHEFDCIKELHGTMQDLQSRIQTLHEDEKKLHDIKLEYDIISREHTKKVADKIIIAREIDELITRKENLSLECNNSAATTNAVKCEKLQAENEQMCTEIGSMRAKLQKIQTEYSSLLDDANAKAENFEILNQEILSVRTKLETLQNEYSIIQNKYEEVQDNCNRKELKIIDIQFKNDEIQRSYQLLQQKCGELENDAVQSNENCSRLQGENNALRLQIDELQSSVEQAHNKLELETKRNNNDFSEISALRQSNEQLKQKLDDQQQSFDELQKEYDEISNQFIDNLQDNENLKKQFASVEEELKKYQLMEKEDDEKREALKAATNNQNNPIVEDSDFPELVLHLRKEVNSLKAQSGELEARILESNAEIENLTAQVDNIKAENALLTKENNKWKQTVESLSKGHSLLEEIQNTPEETIKSPTRQEQLSSPGASSPSSHRYSETVKSFLQLAESLSQIELEFGSGKSRLFKSAYNPINTNNKIYRKIIINDFQMVESCSQDEADSNSDTDKSKDYLQGARDHISMQGTIGRSGFKFVDIEAHIDEPPDSLELEINTSSSGHQSCDSLEEAASTTTAMDNKYEIDKPTEDLQQLQVSENRKSDKANEEVVEKVEDDDMKLYQEQCQEYVKQIRELQGKLTVLLGEKVKLEQSCQENANQSSEMLKKLTDSLKEIEKLKSIEDLHNNLEEQYAEALQNIQKLTNELSLVKIQCAELQTKTAAPIEVQQKTIDWEKKYNSLHAALDEKSAEWETLLKERDVLQSELNDKAMDLEEKVAQLKAELEQSETNQSEQEQEVSEWKEKYNELQSNEAENLEKNKEMQSQLVDLEDKYNTLQSEMIKQSAEYEEITCRLKECSTKWEEKYNNLLNEKESYQHDLQEKILQFSKDLSDSRDSYEKTISELKEQLSNNESKCKCATLAIIEADKAELEKSLKLRIDQLTDAKNDLLESEEKLATVTAVRNRLQDELAEVRESIILLKENIEELKQERSALQKEKLDSQQAHDVLLSEKLNADATCERLLKEKVHLESSVSNLSSEKLNIEAKCGSLRAEKLNSENLRLSLLEEKLAVENKRDSLFKEMLAANNSCDALLKEKLAAESQLESLLKEKLSVESERDNLMQEMLAAVTGRDNLLEEKLSAESQLKCLLKEKLSVESERDNLIKQRSQIETELNALLEERQQLEQKLTRLATEKVHLQNTCDTLQEENQKALNDHSTLSAEKSKLEVLHDLMLQEQKNLKNLLESSHQDRTGKEELIKLLTEKLSNYDVMSTANAKLQKTIENLKIEFETSRNALSVEVEKLQGVIHDCTASRDLLQSNNEDLNSKVQSLSEDLMFAQKKASEYDNLLDKYTKMKAEYDNTTLKQRSKTSELQLQLETVKKQLEEERSLLRKQINDLEGRAKELELKCNSLGASNISLQEMNKSLRSNLEAATKEATRCAALNDEVASLQSELVDRKEHALKLIADNQKILLSNNTLQAQLESTVQEAGKCSKSLNADVDRYVVQLQQQSAANLKLSEETKELKTLLESKETNFTKEKEKLDATITSLISDKKQLEEKLQNAENAIQKLEQEIADLQKRKPANSSVTTTPTSDSTNASLTISPRREKSIEHLIGENHQLKVKNMSLMEKLDSMQQKASQNEERKNRRMSTHDERRRQSYLWHSNHDVCTMTEPTDSSCNCAQLDQKLNECKQTLLIRDSQMKKLSMELANHPLKAENGLLKKRVLEEEAQHRQLRLEVKKYKQLLDKKSQHVAAAAALSPKVKLAEMATQTEYSENDETEKIRKLQSKYEDLKLICRSRHNTIRELEKQISLGKENSNSNVPSSFEAGRNSTYTQQCETLKKELKIYKAKYEDLKILCNMRAEQIATLKAKISESN